MENSQEKFDNYSHRGSFMLYAELALKQGLPVEEVLKRLQEMELSIKTSGTARFDVELSSATELQSRQN